METIGGGGPFTPQAVETIGGGGPFTPQAVETIAAGLRVQAAELERLI